MCKGQAGVPLVAHAEGKTVRGTCMQSRSAREQLHFFELQRLNPDRHPHGLGEEITDIGRWPATEIVVIEADRANVESAKSQPGGGIDKRPFFRTCHYGDFIPLIETGKGGDDIAVKTVGPCVNRSLPTAMALAKRIKLLESGSPASLIHKQLQCNKPGIIRLIDLSHSNSLPLNYTTGTGQPTTIAAVENPDARMYSSPPPSKTRRGP